MSDQPTHPYPDGDVTVLGPEIFASKDGAVISWRGENYVRQQDIQPNGSEMTIGAIQELASAVRDLSSAIRDLSSAIRLEAADRQPPAKCGAPNAIDSQYCELPADHDGRHAEGISSWPRTEGGSA